MASLAGTDLIIVVSVVPATCVLLIIAGIILYCCCCRKSFKTNSGSLKSPFHADKEQESTKSNEHATTPVNRSVNRRAREDSMKRRAQSVTLTYYNEAGEVEEVEGYNDDQLQYTEQNGHALGRQDTTIYQVNQTERVSENDGHSISGNVSGNTVNQDEGLYLNVNDGRQTPDDYIRMSGISDASDDYEIPDIPRDDDDYVKPSISRDDHDDDYVKPNPSAINDDYVNTRDLDLDDEDYMKPASPRADDGYVGPDPPAQKRHEPEEDNYSYAAYTPKGINISNEHDYANQN